MEHGNWGCIGGRISRGSQDPEFGPRILVWLRQHHRRGRLCSLHDRGNDINDSGHRARCGIGHRACHRLLS